MPVEMAANTQYSIALHLLAALAAKGEPVHSRKLASSVNTSPSFVRRILSKLSKAGLVRATTGNEGATSLAKEPKRISLLDIYLAVKAPKAFCIHAHPPLKHCFVSVHIKSVQEKTLGKAQKAFEDSLSAVNLEQFLAAIHRTAKRK